MTTLSVNLGIVCDKNQRVKSLKPTMKLDQLQKFDNLPKHSQIRYLIRTQNSHICNMQMSKNCQMLNVFFLFLLFKINNETNFLFLSHEYADDDGKQHLIH